MIVAVAMQVDTSGFMLWEVVRWKSHTHSLEWRWNLEVGLQLIKRGGSPKHIPLT